jgi:flagellar assembly protein FliH
MMNMSSNSDLSGTLILPVTVLEYRDIADPDKGEAGIMPENDVDDIATGARAEVELSAAEFASRIRQEKEQTAREVESMIRRDYEGKLLLAQSSITSALKIFEEQRNEYFTRVEAEVVQLALSIAAKILHREAQVDPMLVAALVRIAIEKMKEGSSVTVSVSSGRVTSWKAYFAAIPQLAHVEVVVDEKLGEFDCSLESALGSTSFGLDKQLKEIEQGFFDLLALRPSRS